MYVHMCREPVIYVHDVCTAVSGVLMSLQECYFLTVQPNQGVFYNELETRCVVCICVYMCMCICTCVQVCLLTRYTVCVGRLSAPDVCVGRLSAPDVCVGRLCASDGCAPAEFVSTSVGRSQSLS